MTLEEFYKATEGMPMDAEVGLLDCDENGAFAMIATEVEYIKKYNLITIC